MQSDASGKQLALVAIPDVINTFHSSLRNSSLSLEAPNEFLYAKK